MLSTEDKSRLDKIWASLLLTPAQNRLAIIDFVNTLLFIKQLDQIESEKGKISALSGEPIENPIYVEEQQDLRWQSFHYLEEESLFELFYKKNGVLEFVKSLPEYNSLAKFDKEENPVVPPAFLFAETVSLLNQLDVPDNAVRTEMIKYLENKSENQAKIPPPKYVRPVHRIIHIASNDEPRNSWKIKLSNRSYKLYLLSKKSYKLYALFILIAIAIPVIYFNSKKTIPTASNINKPVPPEIKKKDTLSKRLPANQIVKTDSAADTKPVVTVKKVFAEKDTVASIKNIPMKRDVDQLTPKPTVTLPDVSLANEAKANESYTNVESKERYKIIGKAYFHNSPDESSRRNAFVVHWNNSYATLQPLDEKNGFVYVVFRNHQNQTSKGWLRKKDLRPLN